MLELMTVVDYIGGLPVLICQDLVVGRHCRFTLIVPDAPRDHCDQGQRDDSRRQLDRGRVMVTASARTVPAIKMAFSSTSLMGRSTISPVGSAASPVG